MLYDYQTLMYGKECLCTSLGWSDPYISSCDIDVQLYKWKHTFAAGTNGSKIAQSQTAFKEWSIL